MGYRFVLSFAALASMGCQFGAQYSYEVDHGYADRKVMATDPDGEHGLTSDVDAKLFRIYDRNGNEVDTLPWASAGYGGETESGVGPYNGAATAYDAAGFYVAGGNGDIHWIFPFFGGQYATYVIDEVPVPGQSTGRAKVCDISAGNDGSIYVLTGERTGLLDSWALGAAWVHRRAPSGAWTHRQISVNTAYISSLCGYIAFDVVTERLMMLDQVHGWVRRMKPDLSDDGSVVVTNATTTLDIDALAGLVYRARCNGLCGGNAILEILNENGALSDSRNTGVVNAIAVERPPLPIEQDQEAWLWTIGGGEAGPLRKHELLTE